MIRDIIAHKVRGNSRKNDFQVGRNVFITYMAIQDRMQNFSFKLWQKMDETNLRINHKSDPGDKLLEREI